jgi:DNA mismatch repair protein MutS
MAGIPRPVISRASEILKQLQQSSGSAVKIESQPTTQMALFPETNPLLDELKEIDLNTIPPLRP